MTQYEVLSRGSAFALDLEAAARKANVARAAAGQPPLPEDEHHLAETVGFHPIATSLHVVRPFLFIRYYPYEWLQYVRPENIRVSLEFRDNDSGFLVEEFPLLPRVLAHPTRDVAVLFVDLNAITGVGLPTPEVHMEKAVERIHFLQSCWKHAFAEDDCSSSKAGERLVFGGHLLNAEPNDEACQPRPAVVLGNVVRFVPEADMLLADTEFTLGKGMCGGPVMNDRGECVGMIEGAVQDANNAKSSDNNNNNNGDDSSSSNGIRDGLAAVLPARVVEQLLMEALEGRGGERHHPLHDLIYGGEQAP